MNAAQPKLYFNLLVTESSENWKTEKLFTETNR